MSYVDLRTYNCTGSQHITATVRSLRLRLWAGAGGGITAVMTRLWAEGGHQPEPSDERPHMGQQPSSRPPSMLYQKSAKNAVSPIAVSTAYINAPQTPTCTHRTWFLRRSSTPRPPQPTPRHPPHPPHIACNCCVHWRMLLCAAWVTGPGFVGAGW